ncbi:uncharacterized protein LAESUDRAFT_720780 [Laetiporus sulphureus 93-53]|uniref:Uncharacterized protein n=1 Tax=Laetiporus sulphureus 93-53 TaxID=1314785 RepID=A0A165HC11_9APHY|nr:uncharacterized protein LAESUDRAFT_720780 [Laetiporus sulphureus 93-53]KZT11531.1 hypothetical protein LAESUDRAFT_720780 [Laetiporus sulphureus 93-53]
MMVTRQARDTPAFLLNSAWTAFPSMFHLAYVRRAILPPLLATPSLTFTGRCDAVDCLAETPNDLITLFVEASKRRQDGCHSDNIWTRGVVASIKSNGESFRSSSMEHPSQVDVSSEGSGTGETARLSVGESSISENMCVRCAQMKDTLAALRRCPIGKEGLGEQREAWWLES